MKILLCGMGSDTRGDDAFGPFVVEHVDNSSVVSALNCARYPENYIEKMVSYDPDLIVFLDTVKGTHTPFVFLRNEEILARAPSSVSTHSIPFTALYDYLKKRSKADLWFIGVKPSSYESMSEETNCTAHRIIQFFNMLDKQEEMSIIELYETLFSTLK
jgi:hydrogenase 3 maturation protease